jgi:hypothetical protein
VSPRIEELAAQRLEAFERALLVRPHQPRIPRHIGGEDCGEAADRRHVLPAVAWFNQAYRETRDDPSVEMGSDQSRARVRVLR